MAIALSPYSLLRCPLLPLEGPATLTLLVAREAIREWVSCDTSPKFPATTSRTSPSSTSLRSTGPVVQARVLFYFRSASLAFSKYSCYNLSDRMSTARLVQVGLYRVLLQLMILTS